MDCDMTILVDAAKFYLKSRWEERGYAAEFADFIVEKKAINGWQSLVLPFIMFQQVQDSIKNLPDLNWYSNISLAMRNPNP
jgi:iron complex outermembrane receptor protein